jgi:hypothetical protein
MMRPADAENVKNLLHLMGMQSNTHSTTECSTDSAVHHPPRAMYRRTQPKKQHRQGAHVTTWQARTKPHDWHL